MQAGQAFYDYFWCCIDFVLNSLKMDACIVFIEISIYYLGYFIHQKVIVICLKPKTMSF